MRRNSKLKELANLAKQRMKLGNYSEIVNNTSNSFIKPTPASTYFMCNARALRKEYIKPKIVSISLRDDDFENRVIQILSSPDMVINPLGELTDNTIFDSMDEFQRQLYMLQLSDKFNKIKDEYYSKANIA